MVLSRVRRRVACGGGDMSVSDPAHVAQVEPKSALDREARLPPAMAFVTIGVLSAVAWAIVVLVAIGCWKVLS